MSIKKIKLALYSTLVIIGFVPLLNILLLITTPNAVNIIQPNTASATWLAFWGSYLSAIGSFIVAYVSYKQNKETQKQTKAIFEHDNKYRLYESLEKFIKYSCSLHSNNNLEYIICLVKKRKIDDSITECEKYIQKLSYITLDITKYKTIFNTEAMQKFGQTLAEANTVYVKLVQDLLNIIKETDTSLEFDSFYTSKKDKNSKINVFETYIESKTEDYHLNLTHLGFCLLNKQIELLNKSII